MSAFEHRLEENLLELSDELSAGGYRPGPYRSFEIREPKRRLISAAPFRDRLVHHALCAAMEAAFERSFIHDSYANRVGKGTHRALDRAEHFARRYPFVLSLDVRQFFPSIDHEILLSAFSEKVGDPRILDLARLVLAGGDGVLSEEYDMVYFPGDDLFSLLRPRGLPIGNLTSQFWANVYLNRFDHFVKRELRVPGYVRYVDDLLLFGSSKGELWGWKLAVVKRLAGLRLTVHPGAQPRPVSEGISFLGWRLWPERRRLKRRKVVEARRRFRHAGREISDGARTPGELQKSWVGWMNHARWGNTRGLLSSMHEDLRTALSSPPCPPLSGAPAPAGARTPLPAAAPRSDPASAPAPPGRRPDGASSWRR